MNCPTCGTTPYCQYGRTAPGEDHSPPPPEAIERGIAALAEFYFHQGRRDLHIHASAAALVEAIFAAVATEPDR